ncbi:MAG: Gmad2 immunoglobulin-like domain-containing protein [Patescibacteria group bacterium]
MKTFLVVILIILALGAGYYIGKSGAVAPDDNGTTLPPPPVAVTPPPPSVTDKSDLIQVTSPTPNAIVKSPLQIEGKARGGWYFEASFPVSLYDANGKLLARGPAQAEGEWMTQNFVPFGLGLKFDPPTTATGTLVFEKDNPSGLPEQADEYRISVRFR